MLPRRSLLLAAGALAACAAPPRPPPSAPGSAVDALGLEFEGLMAEHGLAEWSRYAGEAAAHDEGQAMASLRERERRTVASLALACQKEANRLAPREVELWLRAERGLQLLGDAKAAALADRLERLINDFSFEADGKAVSRQQLRALARSDDPADRRAANRAWGKLHRLAAPTAIDLLRRRRELGRELGLTGGFHGALLELRGISFERLRVLLGQLDERTRPAYVDALIAARKAAGSAEATLLDADWLVKKLGGPTEQAFPADGALPFARSLWASLGVDLDHPRVRIDVRDFAFAGQTISIHVPDDVRAVVRPTAGSRFYATLMHELGHAFASTRNLEARPVFKGYEWVPGLSEPGYDEGVAEIFGRLLDEPEVLSTHLPALSADDRALLLSSRARGELLGLRSRLISVAFERAALDDPEQDLDALWKRLHRDLLGLEGPADAEATWATSPFLATYPVYTQSYLLAAMLSCQVRAALRGRLGASWVSSAGGALLAAELVADGTRSRMDDKLRRLTGAPLSPDAYAAWLTGA
jgi:hypothetical protein